MKADPQRNLQLAVARGSVATVFGIVVSVVLAAVKIGAGLLGNSYALVADGVESVLDILSSLVVLGSLRISVTPPTDQYPYGLGKVEPLAALAIATILLGAAVGIATQGIREIITPHRAPAPFTLVVLVAVVFTKEVLFRVLFRTGASIGSTVMRVDAWHHRSDAITSLAAFIGISVALIAGEGYESADDWAALFACGVIAFNGVRLFRSALREVLDAAPPHQVENRVRVLAADVEGVHEVEKCRVRRSGLGLFIDIHVMVDGDLSVRRGHDIAHAVKDRLSQSELNVLDVAVHIEPADQP